MSFLEPYFKLGDVLGQLGAGMLSAPIEHIHIRYIGELSSYDVTLITSNSNGSDTYSATDFVKVGESSEDWIWGKQV